MRIYFLGFCFLAISVCSAQRLQQVHAPRMVAGDSTKPAKARTTYQYLGVQANQLLSQLLNFGNNTPSTSNPYLITYALNSIATGVGLNAGLGYTVHSTSDNSDPTTTRTTNVNSFSLRLGIEKKSYITKRWLGSFGFDLLANSDGNDTKVSSKFQLNSNTTDTDATTTYFGFGPRVALNFLITDRIMLGTEATYYFKAIKVSSTVTNTSVSVGTDQNGQPFTTTSSSSTKSSQKQSDFTFSSPVAIFLIMRF